jgi:predicted HTH domain antitoxin
MKKDKSTTVRDLVELGKIYVAILQYKEGKISVGKAAEIDGLSVSEMIDLLRMLGIQNNIEIEDYFAGEKLLKDLI